MLKKSSIKNRFNIDQDNSGEKLTSNSYNNLKHRGIGMSPDEALKEENWEKVKKTQEKYQKEFKERKLESFEIGEKVLIKNELMKGNMDDQFKEKGTIMSKISENIYEIEDENKKIHRKLTSQLRGINKRSLKERVVGSE